MKMLKNALAAVAGAGLLIAQPAMAASTPVRAASPTSQSEHLEGSALWILLGVVAILGILEATSVIDIFDSSPSSP